MSHAEGDLVDGVIAAIRWYTVIAGAVIALAFAATIAVMVASNEASERCGHTPGDGPSHR